MSMYMVTRSPALLSGLWKELFHFFSWGTLLLLSISPIPTSYTWKITFPCLHLTWAIFFHYSQHFVNKSWWKILRLWVGYDLALPTSDVHQSSVSHGAVSKLWWDCKFGTHQIDWFRNDRRRFTLKRTKSVISCCISVSLASCKHTVCSNIVLCSFQRIFGNICCNLPLVDLCFRCGLLFWQVRARPETGRAERATCTTQDVFA